MRYILTAAQMKAADERMIESVGIPSMVLMERAALESVRAMKEEGIDLSRPLIVCGSGNNGGDGFAILRLLLEEGYDAEAVFVGNMDSRSVQCRMQMEILEKLGVSAGNCLPEKEYSVIIDAVFGIGLSREVQGRYCEIIERMNQYCAAKVAIDTPSGIDSDTGRVLGCAFRADLTVTFAYQKAGQVFYPGCEYAGKVLVRQIGIQDPGLDGRKDVYYTFEPGDVPDRMPKRIPDSNKGTYGKVLMISGSKGMSGAAYLGAKAAYMSGAGLVRIYTEESNRQILQQQLPEAVLTVYDADKENRFEALPDLLEWADIVCIGSGLGTGSVSQELMRLVLENNKKAGVIDADGLNILSEMEKSEVIRLLSDGQYVFTPHMKEMSRLSGYRVDELKNQKAVLLKEFAWSWNQICAMKDSRTLVAAPNEKVFLNTSGNAAMAKAGSGDVLAGLIAGLMAQGMTGYDAAVLGVYLHGLAGDTERERLGAYGVMAGDIAEGIRRTLVKLEELR